MKDKLNKAIMYISIILIIGFPLLKLIFYILNMTNIFDGTKYTLYQSIFLWCLLPFNIIIYLIGIFIKKNKITYLDYSMWGLILFAFISTYFAEIREISIFGAEYRHEGLLSLISYYFIFLNLKNLSNEEYKKKIVDIFLYVGLFESIYSILQVYTNFSFINHYVKPFMAMGFCGNPNFLGSYIIMHLLIALSLYLINKKSKYKILTILYFITLCLANSTGPFLAFIISFIFLLIVFRKKIKLKYVIEISIALILTFFIVDYSNKFFQQKLFNRGVEDSYNIATELKDTITNKKNETMLGNGRISLWKNSLPLISRYWLVGAGLDNFGEVYPYQTYQAYYDKAHNIYIQIAVTNGVIPLALYLLICFVSFVKGIRIKNSFYIALFMAFIGYSIQGFSNINVIPVTTCFYIILGLLNSKFEEN